MRKKPPGRNNIIQWHTRFMESANISRRGGNERPRTSEQTVELVGLLFQDQPQLSIMEAAFGLDILQQPWFVFYGSTYSCTHQNTEFPWSSRITIMKFWIKFISLPNKHALPFAREIQRL